MSNGCRDTLQRYSGEEIKKKKKTQNIVPALRRFKILVSLKCLCVFEISVLHSEDPVAHTSCCCVLVNPIFLLEEDKAISRS